MSSKKIVLCLSKNICTLCLSFILTYYILGEIKQSDWFICTMWHICKQRIGPSNSILDSESVYWMVNSSKANQISPYKGPQKETIGHCDVTKKAPLCCHDNMMCCHIVCFCYNVTTSIFNCDITMRKTCTVYMWNTPLNNKLYICINQL